MSDMISNPTTEPDPEAADSVGHDSATDSAEYAAPAVWSSGPAEADFSDQSEVLGMNP